jgi:hypothetical protein
MEMDEIADTPDTPTKRGRPIFLQAATRLILVPLGGLCAVCAFAIVAGVMFRLGDGGGLEAGQSGVIDWVINMGFLALMLGGLPGLVILLACEAFGVRSPWIYMGTGILVLFAGWPIANTLFLGNAPTAASDLSILVGAMTSRSTFFLIPTTAGAAAAGLVYWGLVGRTAGPWRQRADDGRMSGT